MSSVSQTRAYAWAFIERIAPLLVSFVVSVLVARRVAPEAYGLVAMIAIFMALGQAIAELGLGAALVQRKAIDADDETTVFVVNLVAGTVIVLCLALLSPLIAKFLRQPALTAILLVQIISLFLASLSVVPFALLSRRMDFRSGAAIELTATLLSGTVGIVLAYTGFGVWSLVGLSVSRDLIRTGAAWLLVGWRPKGRFSRERAVLLWAYSGKLLYSSLFHRLVTNLYSVLIGRFYSPAQLGLYTRAISLQSLPTGVMVGIVQRVAFPLFSRYQNERTQLLGLLRIKLRVLGLLASAAMGMLALVGAELVPWLLGPQWSDSAPLLHILCFGGVLAALFPLHSATTMALGESDFFLRVELLKKLALLVILLVVSPFGLVAFAWGAVATSLTDYVLSALPSRRLLGYAWRQQCRDVLPGAALSFLTTVALMSVPWPSNMGALAIMVAKCMAYLACLGTGILLFRRSFFREVVGQVVALLRAMNSRQHGSGR